MLAQRGGGWRVSAVATDTWKTNHVPDGHTQLSQHETKRVSISSSARIGGLRLGNCVQRWISIAMRWKRWWQRWNIAKFVWGGSHECSYRNIKNTLCKFVRTCWTNTRLKVTVSWIASSLVTRRGVVWISHRSKCSRRCPQRVRWRTLFLGFERVDPSGSPWTQTNHKLWPLNRDAD